LKTSLKRGLASDPVGIGKERYTKAKKNMKERPYWITHPPHPARLLPLGHTLLSNHISTWFFHASSNLSIKIIFLGSLGLHF
jgi:hypothetical protein